MENYDEIASTKLKKILRGKEKRIMELEKELQDIKKELEDEKTAHRRTKFGLRKDITGKKEIKIQKSLIIEEVKK